MTPRHGNILSWREANSVIEQAERIQRNVLEVTAANHYLATSNRAGAWAPSVNVIETDEFWWVISALPGVEANQVSIGFEGNDLIIAGARPLPTCCSAGELKVWEIPLGRFERRLRLAPGVKFTIGETRIADGLLIAQIKKSL
jgi:HSP20 family molecular chaperone IbpA